MALMPRPRRSIVFLCIAAVALAAFLPGVSAVDHVVFEPTWILLPDLAYVGVPQTPPPANEQPLSLLSLLPSRAPPAPAVA
jgi:hypothetical protein